MQNDIEARIGLDELCLNNFSVIRVDEKKLTAPRDKSKVIYNSGESLDNSGHKISGSVTIIDNNRFNDLKILSMNLPGYAPRVTTELTLTVHHICGDNMGNLSMDEYKWELLEIEDYINEEYGIELDLSSAQIKRIEINCTIMLSKPFAEYDRVIRLLMHNISGREKLGKLIEIDAISKHKKDEHNGKNSFLPETFVRRNKQFEIIIYNKGKELKENDHKAATDSLLRIEFRLLTAAKIQAVFGSKLLSEISHEMVVDYFYGKIYDLFDGPYQNWREKNNKYLLHMIAEFKTSHVPWQQRLLSCLLNDEIHTQVPQLLDIRDLTDLIPPDPCRHRQRTVDSFDKFRGIDEVIFRGDRDKEPEIMAKIDDAYNMSLDLPHDGAPEMPVNGENKVKTQ